MKTAKDADLELDDDLKHEVQEKMGTLSGKKRPRNTKGGNDEDNIDKPLFKEYDDLN